MWAARVEAPARAARYMRIKSSESCARSLASLPSGAGALVVSRRRRQLVRMRAAPSAASGVFVCLFACMSINCVVLIDLCVCVFANQSSGWAAILSSNVILHSILGLDLGSLLSWRQDETRRVGALVGFSRVELN